MVAIVYILTLYLDVIFGWTIIASQHEACKVFSLTRQIVRFLHIDLLRHLHIDCSS